MAKIELLSKSLRLIGETESPDIMIPTDAKPPMGVSLNMEESDLDDENLTIRVEIYISPDGAKWRYWGHFVYSGGKRARKGPPGMGPSNPVSFCGKKIKGKVNTNKSCLIGLDFEDDIDFSRILP